MIDAKELRIGNWVEYENSFFKLHGVDITPKYKNRVGGVVIDKVVNGRKIGFSSAWIDHLTPIPLTPKILETAGFTKQTYAEWERVAYKDTPICTYWDGVEWCFKYGYDSDLTIASCGYVHQLQNLIFALTKKEVEINLL